MAELLRLLVVDDHDVQRKLVAMLLEEAGYAVETASDARQALARLRESAPFAVVSDVVMPEIDGFELCETLRADPALRGVPVVLLTNTNVDHGDRQLAKRSGAYDLVQRTPDLTNLVAVLRAL